MDSEREDRVRRPSSSDRLAVSHASEREIQARDRAALAVLNAVAAAVSMTLDLDEALQRLAALDERQSRIVELRFFGGMSVEEVAHVLGLSKATVESDWRMARAWLRRELTSGNTH